MPPLPRRCTISYLPSRMDPGSRRFKPAPPDEEVPIVTANPGSEGTRTSTGRYSDGQGRAVFVSVPARPCSVRAPSRLHVVQQLLPLGVELLLGDQPLVEQLLELAEL